MIYWELKKMVKAKTSIIVATIFILLCVVMACLTPEMETEKTYRNEQYELIRDLRPTTMIAQEKLDRKIVEIAERANDQQEAEYSKGLKEISLAKLKNMEDTNYKEISFWKVYSYRATHAVMTFCIVIILIILCCNIYTDEINSGVENLILTAKNKNKALYSKVGIGMGIPIVIYASYLIVQFIITAFQYGMPIHGELQAIRIIDHPILLGGAYTIIQFIIIKISVMMLLLVNLSVVACLLSFITTSSIASTSGFMIFMIAGKVLTLVKAFPSNVLMLLENSNFINLLLYFDDFVGAYYGNVKFWGINFDLQNLCLEIQGMTIVAAIVFSSLAFKKILVR